MKEKSNQHQVKNLEKATDVKPRKVIEISEEAKEERRLLEAFLLDKKDELIKEQNRRRKQIEEEKIELRNGKIISRLGTKQFVTSLKQFYDAVFPNSNPFFKNMFRLHPYLYSYDPNEYIKPPLAGRLLKHLTYDRFNIEFSTDVLPALRVLAMPDGVRLDKFYFYLTPKGVEYLIQFRDQANEMMKNFSDSKWYEFNFEYCKKYGLVCQPRLF